MTFSLTGHNDRHLLFIYACKKILGKKYRDSLCFSPGHIRSDGKYRKIRHIFQKVQRISVLSSDPKKTTWYECTVTVLGSEESTENSLYFSPILSTSANTRSLVDK